MLPRQVRPEKNTTNSMTGMKAMRARKAMKARKAKTNKNAKKDQKQMKAKTAMKAKTPPTPSSTMPEADAKWEFSHKNWPTVGNFNWRLVALTHEVAMGKVIEDWGRPIPQE